MGDLGIYYRVFGYLVLFEQFLRLVGIGAEVRAAVDGVLEVVGIDLLRELETYEQDIDRQTDYYEHDNDDYRAEHACQRVPFGIDVI